MKFLHIRQILIITLLLLPFGLIGQSKCDEAIDEARRQYTDGQFEELITLLDGCYTSFKGKNARQKKIEARKLKAQAYLSIDKIKKAEKEIVMLLSLQPTFEPSPLTDSPLFIDLVAGVKSNMTRGVITSVSKKAENINVTPATLTILTAADIRKRGYTDLEQLFHDVSGFDISRSSGFAYSNIYQRGYRSATSTDRTLILIDGVEDNSIFSNTAFISRQYPISNIKRVEIIYGPASTMYGANAFLGVINIVTKDEKDLFKGNSKIAVSANTGYGTYNTRYIDATFGVNNKRIAFTLTGRLYRSDERDLSSFSNWDYNWANNGYDASYYQSTLTLDTTGNLSSIQALDPNNIYHTITGSSIVPTDFAVNEALALDNTHYQEINPGNFAKYTNPTDDWYISGKLRIDDLLIGIGSWRNREGVSIGRDNYFAGGVNGNQWQSGQTYAFLKYGKYISDAFYLSVFNRFKITTTPPSTLIQYESFANSSLNLLNLANNSAPYWSETHFYRFHSQLRSELRMIYSPREEIDIVGGIEYRNSAVQGSSLTSSDSLDPILEGSYTLLPGGNEFNIVDLGAYTQVTYNVIDSFYLTLGTRWDNNRIRDGGYGNVFNSRVALVYQFKDFIAKGIFSQAFKDATPFQRFEQNTTRLASPRLQPEDVDNFELSLKYQPSPYFYAEVIAYKAFYTGAVEDTVINGLSQFQNLGSLEIEGIQARSEFRTGDLSFYVNYTLTNPINTRSKGNTVHIRVGDIAAHQINFGGNGSFFEKQLNINLRGNYVGAKPTGSSTTVSGNPLDLIDAYLIFHGAVTFRSNKYAKGLTLQVALHNILDNNILNSTTNEYYHPGVRGATDTFYTARSPQNRRNFMFKLFYDF